VHTVVNLILFIQLLVTVCSFSIATISSELKIVINDDAIHNYSYIAKMSVRCNSISGYFSVSSIFGPSVFFLRYLLIWTIWALLSSSSSSFICMQLNRTKRHNLL